MAAELSRDRSVVSVAVRMNPLRSRLKLAHYALPSAYSWSGLIGSAWRGRMSR